MTEMTPIVKAYFQTAGWFEGRDVSESFKFPEGKIVHSKALEIMKEFGYLKVAYRCIDGDEFLYMDIDDSEASKVLRRDYFEQYYKYTSWAQELIVEHSTNGEGIIGKKEQMTI